MTVDLERESLTREFASAYPDVAARPSDIRIVRAPGRVNLIGEHTDYNDGYVMPAAIDLEIWIAYVPTDNGRVELRRLDDGDRDGFDLDAPRPKASTWLDYVVGTAWALEEAGFELMGLRGVIASTLPADSGLSSSAAIELSSAWAMLDEAASHVDRFHLAKICQRAENAYVGVQSGLMDQFAESCGQAGAAMFLDCRSGDWRPIPLPEDIAIVVCHTGSPRHLGGSEYNLRRSQCEAAVAAIQRLDPTIHSLRDVSPELLNAARPDLSDVEYARAEHVVTENVRVGETVAALEAGDLDAVGNAVRRQSRVAPRPVRGELPGARHDGRDRDVRPWRRCGPHDRCRFRWLHRQSCPPRRGRRASRRGRRAVSGHDRASPKGTAREGDGRRWTGFLRAERHIGPWPPVQNQTTESPNLGS